MGVTSIDPSGSEPLTPQEQAVLKALVECAGRVINRTELARRSGLADRSERRCDAVLVGLRRRLGPENIRTVRSRGWILEVGALASARQLLES